MGVMRADPEAIKNGSASAEDYRLQRLMDRMDRGLVDEPTGYHRLIGDNNQHPPRTGEARESSDCPINDSELLRRDDQTIVRDDNSVAIEKNGSPQRRRVGA